MLGYFYGKNSDFSAILKQCYADAVLFGSRRRFVAKSIVQWKRSGSSYIQQVIDDCNTTLWYNTDSDIRSVPTFTNRHRNTIIAYEFDHSQLIKIYGRFSIDRHHVVSGTIDGHMILWNRSHHNSVCTI
jgi:hypothetical protein